MSGADLSPSPLMDVPGMVAPDARGEEATWFEHCRQRRLTFHRCGSCSAVLFPPRGACPACGGTDLRWEDSAGHGRVYSYTVQRRRVRPEMPESSVVALIDVDEGFRIMTRLVCEPDQAAIGMQVAVAFTDAGGAVVPVFIPG